METQKEFSWLERKGQEGKVRMRAVCMSVLRPEGHWDFREPLRVLFLGLYWLLRRDEALAAHEGGLGGEWHLPVISIYRLWRKLGRELTKGHYLRMPLRSLPLQITPFFTVRAWMWTWEGGKQGSHRFLNWRESADTAFTSQHGLSGVRGSRVRVLGIPASFLAAQGQEGSVTGSIQQASPLGTLCHSLPSAPCFHVRHEASDQVFTTAVSYPLALPLTNLSLTSLWPTALWTWPKSEANTKMQNMLFLCFSSKSVYHKDTFLIKPAGFIMGLLPLIWPAFPTAYAPYHTKARFCLILRCLLTCGTGALRPTCHPCNSLLNESLSLCE